MKNSHLTEKAHGILFLDKNRYVRFANPVDYVTASRYVAKTILNEQGFKFNKTGRIAWLQSEVDAANDMDEETYTIEGYIYCAADLLFTCNAPHIIGKNNTQVSSDFISACIDYISDLMTTEVFEEQV